MTVIIQTKKVQVRKADFKHSIYNKTPSVSILQTSTIISHQYTALRLQPAHPVNSSHTNNKKCQQTSAKAMCTDVSLFLHLTTALPPLIVLGYKIITPWPSDPLKERKKLWPSDKIITDYKDKCLLEIWLLTTLTSSTNSLDSCSVKCLEQQLMMITFQHQLPAVAHTFNNLCTAREGGVTHIQTWTADVWYPSSPSPGNFCLSLLGNKHNV